jgi:hypothetical protein
VEAFADGGVMMGLKRDVARELAAQSTFIYVNCRKVYFLTLLPA